MSSADQVTSLYATILNRAPDPAGLAYWTQALDGGFSSQQVQNGFAYSPEARYDVGVAAVAAKTFLTDAAIIGYEGQLADGSSLAQVQINIRNNHVVALYKDILNRAPDAAGLSYWQGQLAQGASIQDMQNGIAYSQEAHNRVQAEAALHSIPLSGIEITSYQTQLAAGRILARMFMDLADSNLPIYDHMPGQALPNFFISGVLTDETAPVGGSVQPFAALHLNEHATDIARRFDVTVALSGYGISGGSPPLGTTLSAPPGASFTADTRDQEQDLLDKLTLHLDSNGDGVTIGLTVSDGDLFPDKFYTNVSAASISPVSGLNYTYGSLGVGKGLGPNLLSGSDASDLLVLGFNGAKIVNFDPAHDILQVSKVEVSSFAAVQANISSVGPGTFIQPIGANAINLIGVSPSSLHPENFSLCEDWHLRLSLRATCSLCLDATPGLEGKPIIAAADLAEIARLSSVTAKLRDSVMAALGTECGPLRSSRPTWLSDREAVQNDRSS